jgi:flagellar FliL protein
MAKEDQAAAEAPAEGGSKKKLFIIIGAAVLVLVIAGVVAFLMMGRGDKKKEGADAHGAPAAADAGHGAPAADGHGAAGAAGASTVFPLEPFIVNIYDGQDLRYLKVKIELEMVNPMVKGELDSHLAAVRDAILVVLTTKTLQEVQDVQGKNQLREEILTAISKILAQGKVSKVYFTDFVVQ